MPLELSPADRRVLGLLCLLLLVIYLLTMAGRLTSGDGETVYQTTKAMVTRRQLSVPPRPETALGRTGAYYGKYGLGQSLVQAPFYVVGHVAGRLVGATDDRASRFAVASANAFVTTALVALVWLLARTLGAGAGAATAVALTLGLGTLLWPYARSDFSEPLQTLLLLLAFLLMLWWSLTPTRWLAVGVGSAAAGAFLTKAASTVPLAPLGAYFLYLVWRRLGPRPPALLTLMWAGLPFALAVLAQASLNLYRFGSVSEFGYGSEPAVGFTTPVLSGIGYLLFSTGKGFVWFATPAALGALLLPLLARHRSAETLAIGGVFVCELLYFARWWAWHGDWSWGPRYLYLTVPFLLLPFALLLQRAVVRGLFAAVSAVGVAVAILGVSIDYGGYYSIVGAQLGRGVDVADARLVPPFSPILGHAWLARASLHHAVSSGNDRDHDPRENPAWGQHPWAASHPDLVPEAPERAVGFDFWFLALPERNRFAEFWSWLSAAWLAAGGLRLGLAFVRALRPSLHRRRLAVLTRDTPDRMELAWQRG
ncbi:MAG TPA: hypothetical protein VFN74_23685 [Chloroflexota bacterium]|nr:hypothetical protein [Chloroflexota bacterium]